MKYTDSHGVVHKDRNKITYILLALMLAIATTFAFASTVSSGAMKCTTIQSGMLLDTAGNTLETGYDQWGYNYQGHMFNGYYDNYTRPTVPYDDGDGLQMKWNDAWLSNKDCDGDYKLDRHYGYDSYIGSGAWLTNHITWDDDDGHHMYFIKIVAAPADAYKMDGTWYTADHMEIGPVIWGSFAIVMEVESGLGSIYVSPIGPGFGQF